MELLFSTPDGKRVSYSEAKAYAMAAIASHRLEGQDTEAAEQILRLWTMCYEHPKEFLAARSREVDMCVNCKHRGLAPCCQSDS